MRFLLTSVLSLLLAAHTLANAIPFRGVVEGFYGRPWGTEGRLSTLKFMSENKMNTFIYGPKDDPYHHTKWREAYPAAEMEDFSKLLAVAKKNDIHFYWAIHLGGSFNGTDESDYQALFQKLTWMHDAGFRAFAVFFDDFGSPDAKLHSDICNRIQTDFLDKKGDCAPLIMCPNIYWNTGHVYQKTIGGLLDKRVNVMWTGKQVCHDIRKKDVEQITADLQRPPFIWWNWPVNDYCRSKILLGRTYGLDDCTYAGFVANPMENCEANKIGLYGVAKWAQDPAHFDSKKTWEEAFSVLYPDEKIARAMRLFAEHNSDQGPSILSYRREESVSAASLCSRARTEYATTGTLAKDVREQLKALFIELRDASSFLNTTLEKRRSSLGWELEGWFEAEIAEMETGLRVLALFEKDAAREEIFRDIKRLRDEADVRAEAHRAKFAAATFPNDRRNIQKPVASARELKLTIEELLMGELKKACKEKTGRDYAPIAGFEAISRAKELPNLIAIHDENYAELTPVKEQKVIQPGEYFGLGAPWDTVYFHARLGTPEALTAGIIEISKDGKTWETFKTQNGGETMHQYLNPKDGWHWARYRNISDQPVTLKINLFRFTVNGARPPLDEILATCLASPQKE